jgi:glycosyltransferase involved in cell wall biosynthesis
MGLAGAFVFSWTDDWHTGGHRVENWAFGITHRDRSPKAAYHALREVFEGSPARFLAQAPRVSVVVCAYNAGRTLEQCLRSLRELDYPDYEVIVVDDGSTDDTRAIIARFPEWRAIHQENAGLSVARNVGLDAATGDIVAYTDADCFADPHWLTHLVHQLERSGAAAVGGPNLTPEDGWLAACVAASPGQPTHVLECDQVAEHIPGCNMAFRREALLAINGFDPLYRQAGDDVDVCWRLQQAGLWITFAPGAFVWHHRRQGPRTYLRQQAGYGRAEALLRFKHPDRFNGRGDGKWRGVLYGASLQGLRLGKEIVYRGTFGSGLFQCVYQPGPSHWAMLPSTLEWHLAVAAIALGAIFWWPAALLAAGLLLVSVLVAALQAAQARVAAGHDGLTSRLVIAGLCYAQPLVRSWHRYRTRLFAPIRKDVPTPVAARPARRFPLTGRRTVEYWDEGGCERTDLLRDAVAYLHELHWAKLIDSGWTDWDLVVFCHAWTRVEVCTTQENHGGSRRLIRVRYRLRLRTHAKVILAAALACVVGGLVLGHWLPVVTGATIVALAAAAWWQGAGRTSQVESMLETVAGRLGAVRLDREHRERSGPHRVRPAGTPERDGEA